MPDCPIVQCIETEYWIKKPTGEKGPLQLESHQKQILNRWFTPKTEEPYPKFDWRTFIYSCPKKSGKTETAAAVAYAFLRLYGGECYSIANDAKQAESRMFERVINMLRLMKEEDEPLFCTVVQEDFWDRVQKGGRVVFNDNDQVNPGPHSLQFVASDYAGEAGALNALVVFDEIWGITQERGERLWTEMQPQPAIPISLRFVSTYAGFYGESELLYGIFDAVCQPDKNEPRTYHGERVDGLNREPVYQKGNTVCYWDHEGRMPWQTDGWMSEAFADPSIQGRETEFRRLWMNEWSTGLEPFLSMEVIQKCIAKGVETGLYNQLERK